METIVVIHGSAVGSPDWCRDVDVIFLGDPRSAQLIARAWAVDRLGIRGETIPLDLHKAPQNGDMVVPRVPGADAPYEVVSGSSQIRPLGECVRGNEPTLRVGEQYGIAAWLRSPLPAREVIAGMTRSGAYGGSWVRFSLSEAVSEEWTAYVDGPRAIRRALAKCAPEKLVELRELDPNLLAVIEAVAEVGDRYVPAAVCAYFGDTAGPIEPCGASTISGGKHSDGWRFGADASSVRWTSSEFERLLRGQPSQPIVDPAFSFETIRWFVRCGGCVPSEVSLEEAADRLARLAPRQIDIEQVCEVAGVPAPAADRMRAFVEHRLATTDVWRHILQEHPTEQGVLLFAASKSPSGLAVLRG